MKDKIEINLMYTELKIAMAKTMCAKMLWAFNHDLTLLFGKLFRLI